ncbi:MAG: hypothetical protein GXX90_06770 [Microbacteriaceae bacterium]|nr:hypothetical protein [Microbacteriaceae bacterium]
MTSDAVITTYLQDHRAGSIAGIDMFQRVAEHHNDPEVREAVARIAVEVERDQDDLDAIMTAFGAKPSVMKEMPAKIGEKLARLKPNERLGGRSPLDDVEDLELLVIAVHGKTLGWELLLELDDPRLDRNRLRELVERAKAQHAELERLRRTQAPKLLRD